jgi:NAD(P)-dependent dehydrogenase (short-subunit alcohol dehydrogenase family)
VTLVTGASGGGVGSATARLLAARGADVVVTYLQNRAGADAAFMTDTVAHVNGGFGIARMAGPRRPGAPVC